MLLRVSRNVAHRTPRATAVVVEARRAFVQPSSSNHASVIDPPPTVPENGGLFRPRAGTYIRVIGQL
jgi:hypothetical protein